VTRHLATIVLSFFAIYSQSTTAPAPQAISPVTIVGPSRSFFPDTLKRKGFMVEVSRDESGTPEFPDDYLILRVFSEEEATEPIAAMKFVSTYGKFQLTLVDVTGDGREEYLLTTGTCHGTNCREETLTVWRLRQKGFDSILSVPTSGYCGRRRWWYEQQFPILKGHSTRTVRLVLHYDKGDDPICDPAGIPKSTLREYSFDQRSAKMILKRGVKDK
jgi:hypothetical protein